ADTFAASLKKAFECLEFLDENYEKMRDLETRLNNLLEPGAPASHRVLNRGNSKIAASYRRDRFRSFLAWSLRNSEFRNMGKLHDTPFDLSVIPITERDFTSEGLAIAAFEQRFHDAVRDLETDINEGNN